MCSNNHITFSCSPSSFVWQIAFVCCSKLAIYCEVSVFRHFELGSRHSSVRNFGLTATGFLWFVNYRPPPSHMHFRIVSTLVLCVANIRLRPNQSTRYGFAQLNDFVSGIVVGCRLYTSSIALDLWWKYGFLVHYGDRFVSRAYNISTIEPMQ